MISHKISLIAAMAENRGIGFKNKLPWELPEDLKRFRAITSGHPVVMGRKTFESIGRPLPKRLNIVITRDPTYSREGIETAPSLERAIEIAQSSASLESEVFVIGGAEIYRLAMPIADRLYVTLVEGSFKVDAFFPEWDAARFCEVSREKGDRCSYVVLESDRSKIIR